MNDEALEGEFIAKDEWEAEESKNRPSSEMSIEEILADTSW